MPNTEREIERDLLPKPVWRRRWAMIRLSLVFCAGVIVFLLYEGQDSRINETIVYGIIGLASAIILGYLGFGVADDLNWMKQNEQRGVRRRRRRSTETEYVEEEGSI